MKTKNEIKIGDKITYEQQIMFKGIETITAKVVAIGYTTMLLDNGKELYIF
ncbi:MAG: hypothetical protein LBN95_03900 [Prevotellaceae bacterium]|jgi:hypothetical protein|nr:hypothetical protein [Prevotellaceae bacterium]